MADLEDEDDQKTKRDQFYGIYDCHKPVFLEKIIKDDLQIFQPLSFVNEKNEQPFLLKEEPEDVAREERKEQMRESLYGQLLKTNFLAPGTSIATLNKKALENDFSHYFQEFKHFQESSRLSYQQETDSFR